MPPRIHVLRAPLENGTPTEPAFRNVSPATTCWSGGTTPGGVTTSDITVPRCVWPEPSVIATPNRNDPASVGVPESTPVALNVRPGGIALN